MSRSFCTLRPGSERNVQWAPTPARNSFVSSRLSVEIGHETAVADLHLAVELQEPFVLPPVFWTEASAGEHQHQRIASLQLRERAVLPAVVRKLVVGKDGAGNDVGPHRRARLHVERAILGCLLGSPPALARDDVGGVPIRPVVLRSGRFVLAMVLLCLSQKLCQRRDVEVAESSSGKPRLDLLEQPAVAVRIAERGVRAVGATVAGRGPARRGPPKAVKWNASLTSTPRPMSSARAASMSDTTRYRFLDRARRGRRDSLAEVDRARRAGRCHLHHPPVLAAGEIGVQPPPQALVEALGAIDVGHRNDDDLELQIDRRGGGHVGGVFIDSSVCCSCVTSVVLCVRDLRGELVQAFPEHPVEGWERVDDVGERLQRSAQLDRQHELAHDLARTRSDQRRADQHPALAVADQLERAAVKVVDVAARGLGRIGGGDDDVDASSRARRPPTARPTRFPDR